MVAHRFTFVPLMFVAVGLLAGCASSSSSSTPSSEQPPTQATVPQVCIDLRPIAERVAAEQAALEADPTNETLGFGFVATLEELAVTSLALADTPSARQEGIDDDLRDVATGVRGFPDQDSVVLTGIASSAIGKVCGFGALGERY